MNKKEIGASVRRGILTGTLAGFVAGWLAFAGYAKKFDAAEVQAAEAVRERAAELVLPAVPGLPQLGPLPTAQAYRVTTGPDRPMPRLMVPGRGALQTTPAVPGAPSVAVGVQAPGLTPPPAAIAPAPTFAPLPALPPVAPKPKPTTKTS
jgi:hypothetical protein